MKTLEQSHAFLFRCLKVDVVTALDWTKRDVELNMGIFLDDTMAKPREMKVVEARLLNKRIYSVSRFSLS